MKRSFVIAIEHRHRALLLYERIDDRQAILKTCGNLSLIYGEAKDFVADGHCELGGSIPTNTHGGHAGERARVDELRHAVEEVDAVGLDQPGHAALAAEFVPVRRADGF